MRMADLVLDFDACKSVVKRGNSGRYNLKPVVAVLPRVRVDGLVAEGQVAPAIALGTTTVSLQQGGVPVRTTVPDPKQPCPLDRVNRQFKADRPNQLWVSDFTYVSTWQGWLYVAFVIDVFARRIVGWRVSRSMTTDFVLDALEQALYARQPERDGSLVHHSDRGSQYVSIRYSERLSEAGIEPSVGSKGDSYDNALAETINGLYKAELIHRRGPWKTREAVELATLEWVAWFNHIRLLEPIGYIPPAEAEANYYRQLAEQAESMACT